MGRRSLHIWVQRRPLGLRFGPLSNQGPLGNPNGTPLGPNTLVRAWFVIWEEISLFGNNQIISKTQVMGIYVHNFDNCLTLVSKSPNYMQIDYAIN